MLLYLNKTSEQMKLHVDLLSVILALQQVCFLGGWGYGGNFLTYDFEDATSNSLVGSIQCFLLVKCFHQCVQNEIIPKV